MPKVRARLWSNNAQSGIVKGKLLNPSAAIEQRYYTALRVLIERMTIETDLELKKLFKTEHAEEFFAEDASISSQARILTNALIKKYTDLFASISKPMAERFAEESNKSSDIAVKSSIRHLSDELTLSTRTITSGPLNDILSATVTENVGLIKSIPAQYLNGVQGAVIVQLRTQSQDTINPETTALTLVLPTDVVDYLSVTSDFGVSVRDWLEQTYKKTRIVSAPQLNNANG